METFFHICYNMLEQNGDISHEKRNLRNKFGNRLPNLLLLAQEVRHERRSNDIQNKRRLFKSD